MIELNLTKPGARVLLALLTLAGCALLALLIVSRFVIGTLADRRLQVTRGMLKIPVEYLPGSARLNARLAAAEFSEGDRDLASARLYAERAVTLSPFDYRVWMTLASIEEATGDRRAAEEALRTATELAPNYWSVHYRLGNLLVREGKVAESLEEFRKAIAANDTLTPGALDLVWQASRENVDAVRSVCENNTKARFALAQFLLAKSKPVEAAGVFMSIDRASRLSAAAESSVFMNGLIAAGKLENARDLWSDLVGVERGAALIWNGGFESDIQRSFSQFDWSFNRSEYAVLSIDPSSPHSGSHSLKIEFAGRDTTTLDNEVKQLVAVTPGARYVLECYFKTEGFEAPEGPRIVVTDASSTWIAASEPVPAGSSDWRRLSLEFVAPQKGAVVISIKRKPKFSYDEPTRGTVWFDDFSMKQV